MFHKLVHLDLTPVDLFFISVLCVVQRLTLLFFITLLKEVRGCPRLPNILRARPVLGLQECIRVLLNVLRPLVLISLIVLLKITCFVAVSFRIITFLAALGPSVGLSRHLVNIIEFIKSLASHCLVILTVVVRIGYLEVIGVLCELAVVFFLGGERLISKGHGP